MKIHKRRILTCLAGALAAASPVLAGSYSNDFSSANPDKLTLVGSGTRGNGDSFTPVIENGHLVLTYAENGLQGSAFLDELDPGATVDSFTANFTVRVGGGSSTPADGWSFAFASDLDAASPFGEEGPTTANGLTVSFDIYDNGGGEAPAIDVKLNGNTVAHKTFSISDMLSDSFVPVSIQLKKNGSLNVAFKGNVIYTNLFLEGYAPITGGRFAFGARTGGLNANQWVDDLNISTTVSAGNVVPTVSTQPQSQTVAERSSVTFSVVPEGTPPFTFQWLSNNAAIAGATGRSYTITNAPFTANGAKYKVQITNPAGSVTSGEATLTVQQDVTAPSILSVRGNESFNGVLVTFSEPVTAATAGAAANYSFSGGLTVSGVTVLSPTEVLLATSRQTPGTTYTLNVTGIQDTASTPNTIAANTSRSFQPFVLSRGFLKFEYWGGIETVNVQALLDDPRYQANTPDLTGYISPFDTRSIFPDDSHENYGARISGFLTPPSTGDYRFFVSSDDASQLYLSSNQDPANLAMIAEEPGCCNGFTEPSSGMPRTSEPIHLEAGRNYYVQYLLKEGGGGDYGRVAWRKEGDTTPAASLAPIPGAYLSTYADPGAAQVTISQQPQSRTAAENTTTSFAVSASGSPAPIFYQWQRAAAGSSGFTDIPGANSATYTTPVLKQAADNNSRYRVIVGVPGGSVTSSEATLTVNIDNTPPALVSATAGPNLKTVTLKFSEAVDTASGAVAGNYSIPGLTISSAKLTAPDTVLLTTSAQAEGTNYTVTISNVKDTAGNLISSSANSVAFSSLIVLPGALKFDAYTGIGGTAVQDLTSNAKYPASPDYSSVIQSFSTLNGFGDNYGARVTGFIIPKQTGDYRFFVSSDDSSALYISTSDSPADLPSSPNAREPGCCNAFAEPAPDNPRTSEPVHLEAGKRYYVLYLLKEGGGGDYGMVAWRNENDPTAAADLKPIGPDSLATAVEPAVLQGISLPVSAASPVGSGDANAPGFKVRIHQVDGAGAVTLANTISRAEQQLAGIIGPNVADLSQAQNGVFNIPDVINWNQEMNAGGNSTETGDFQSATGQPDQPIPGIPGTGNAAHNLDNIAAEVITYVEFPAPGIYYLGVNSDDGFNMTATDQAPANNLALVVTGGAAAGTYHAVSGGDGDGGVFAPIKAPISGKLVYAQPADGCSAILNTNEIQGNVALIDRGVCTFSAKVQAAKDAGAIAAVIVNSRDPDSSDGPFPIVMTGTSVDLPAVMISKPDGAKIKAALAAGVIISIQPDTTKSLGQANLGRGSSDTIFAVNVQQAGVYPLRTVWFEGGGGANLEIFSVNNAGEKILLNDRSNPGALKTYRARTGVTAPPQMTISRTGSQLTISWTNGGVLESSTTVNGGYTPVANANNPHTFTPAADHQFFRIRR